MKDNTKKTIKGFGKFFGASAYGFTHMPILVVREIKEMRAIKKRERAYKGIKKLEEYCNEMVADGSMSEEKRTNLLLIAALNYISMLNE